VDRPGHDPADARPYGPMRAFQTPSKKIGRALATIYDPVPIPLIGGQLS
jgi:hypothetical protein